MKRKSICALLLIASLGASAQTLLGGADITKKLPANFSVGAGVEYRSQDWFSNTNQWSVEVSGSYKPIKPVKIGIVYKFIQSRESETYELPAYWETKHRASIGITGEWKPVRGLSLSLRERYQYTYRQSVTVPYFDVSDGNKTVSAKSKHVMRTRVMAEYKPYKKCRFTPYVSFELYSLVGDINHTKDTRKATKFCDKYRATAGSDFRINKKNSLSLFYRYTYNTDIDDNDCQHTIGLTYSFKF